MENQGPALEVLLHRIAETPDDFLALPKIGNTGEVSVPAVVHDLCERLGAPVKAEALASFAGTDPKKDRNRLSIALLLAWVLADDWFAGIHPTTTQVLDLLGPTSVQLAQHAASTKYLNDPDRREEVARLVLAHFGYRPAGESKAQAQDRLTSLSLVERERVLRAAREAEARARTIREALAKKAAEESADKWTRE